MLILKFDAEIIQWQDNDGFQEAFDKAFSLLGSKFNLGIEGQIMRAFEMQAIQNVSKGYYNLKIVIKLLVE